MKMKNIMWLVLIAVVAMGGCKLREGKSFEEVSTPYIMQFGEPNNIVSLKDMYWTSEAWTWISNNYETLFLYCYWDDMNIYEWRVVYEGHIK